MVMCVVIGRVLYHLAFHIADLASPIAKCRSHVVGEALFVNMAVDSYPVNALVAVMAIA